MDRPPRDPKPSRSVRRERPRETETKPDVVYDHVYEPPWTGNVDHGRKCRVLATSGYMRTIEFDNRKRTTCNADAIRKL